ncbi:hypothetical protein WA026_021406 [Henosepilachna vigintioctopunctata]|uniref:Protein kinase domain-containing protein n=1 Tax=Henosepilachna vigintioctopunctata TaxID=420089 RepID=A0AAW1TS60_9CUCU
MNLICALPLYHDVLRMVCLTRNPGVQVATCRFKSCGFQEGKNPTETEVGPQMEPDPEPEVETEVEPPNVNIEAEWNEVTRQLPSENPLRFEEFALVDEGVAVTGTMTDDDILDSFTNDEDAASDEDHEEKEPADVTSKEARATALGTPSEAVWPGYNELPIVRKTNFVQFSSSMVRSIFEPLTDSGFDLVTRMLTYDPNRRITAKQALQHTFFGEENVLEKPSTESDHREKKIPIKRKLEDAESQPDEMVPKKLGAPSEAVWHGYNELPIVRKTNFVHFLSSNVRSIFGPLTHSGFDLVTKMLTHDPGRRNMEKHALQHTLFKVESLPAIPSTALKSSSFSIINDGVPKIRDCGNPSEFAPTTKSLFTNGCPALVKSPAVLHSHGKYGVPIDMWSISCILAEISLMGAPSNSELDQIHKIFKVA